MARRVSLVLAFATVVGCASATAIVLQSPPTKPDEAATVVGRLELVSTTYFRHAKFAVVDENNNRVFVTPWAPLEVPPSPKPTTEHLSTMRDFLGKRLAVTGIYRSARDFPKAATAIAAPDLSFLDVTSVKDLERGVEVFKGRPRFVLPPGSSGPRSENARPGTPPERSDSQSTQPPRTAVSPAHIPATPPSTTPPRLAAPPAQNPIPPAPPPPRPRVEPGAKQKSAPAPTMPPEPATAPSPAQGPNREPMTPPPPAKRPYA